MNHKKILIADDNENIREALTYLLEDEGYKLSLAKDGAETLKKVKEVQPDILFLDIMMPEINGYDVCRAIKSDPALKNIYVIMLTAKGQVAEQERGKEVGRQRVYRQALQPHGDPYQNQEHPGSNAAMAPLSKDAWPQKIRLKTVRSPAARPVPAGASELRRAENAFRANWMPADIPSPIPFPTASPDSPTRLRFPANAGRTSAITKSRITYYETSQINAKFEKKAPSQKFLKTLRKNLLFCYQRILNSSPGKRCDRLLRQEPDDRCLLLASPSPCRQHRSSRAPLRACSRWHPEFKDFTTSAQQKDADHATQDRRLR